VQTHSPYLLPNQPLLPCSSPTQQYAGKQHLRVKPCSRSMQLRLTDIASMTGAACSSHSLGTSIRGKPAALEDIPLCCTRRYAKCGNLAG
jgi:hypothetical protein